MKITCPVTAFSKMRYNCLRPKTPVLSRDLLCFCAGKSSINRDILVKRHIIPPSCNLEDYFNDISNGLFTLKSDRDLFFSFLNDGSIALSSSVLKDIKNPASAVALKLDENLSDANIFLLLSPKIAQGKGIGVNFSNFKNPHEKIKKINAYFKYKENISQRPPAGIALLNINHPEILDFITMKDNEDFKNWCFDLSVILPSDFINKVDNNKDIILENGEKLNSRVLYKTLLNSMLKKGEPGIIFSEDKSYICDPCGAKKLSKNEKFIISHINLSKFYDDKNNSVDKLKLQSAAGILSKAMKNISNNSCIGVAGFGELLKKLGINYSDKKSLSVLSDCLKTIKTEVNKNGIKTAISPTGTVSKYLNTTAGIQPENYNNISYMTQLEVLSVAQKYTDCNISNTVILDNNADKSDVDKIIRYAAKNGLKGITVFKPRYFYSQNP